jgi:hypothetical protein
MGATCWRKSAQPPYPLLHYKSLKTGQSSSSKYALFYTVGSRIKTNKWKNKNLSTKFEIENIQPKLNKGRRFRCSWLLLRIKYLQSHILPWCYRPTMRQTNNNQSIALAICYKISFCWPFFQVYPSKSNWKNRSINLSKFVIRTTILKFRELSSSV